MVIFISLVSILLVFSLLLFLPSILFLKIIVKVKDTGTWSVTVLVRIENTSSPV